MTGEGGGKGRRIVHERDGKRERVQRDDKRVVRRDEVSSREMSNE